MICPLTGSSLYNQLMRWKKKTITVTSSKSDTAKAAVIHLLNDGSCVFLACMAAATSALWCCLINAAGLWCLKIHSTAWFIGLSIFFGGGGVLRLTKCILGPWQSSPKLFRIYNTMLGRERENADEISSCCSAKAICMTSLSWKSHSRARKWLPLRWNLSFQRPVGCEWEVRFLNLCLKPSDVTPWQKSLKG